MNVSDKVEWQFVDEKLGLIYPYYTESFLRVLDAWHLEDKNVFEWGGGKSTIWWAARAKSVTVVEDSAYWMNEIYKDLKEVGLTNKVHTIFMDWDYPEPGAYVPSIDNNNKKFDIIIVDGLFRDECTIKALDILQKGGVLIIDNWMQPSVEMASLEVQTLVKNYEHHIYKQMGHPDWQTLVLYK